MYNHLWDSILQLKISFFDNLSQMQIRALILMTKGLLETTVYFLDPILSPGHPRSKMLFLDHQLSQNTRQLQKFYGFYLLQELRVQLSNTLVLYCDNKSAEALASNPKYHSQTKHIKLDFHFVREHIAKKELVVEHVSSFNQLADVLTKPLGFDHFAYMRDKLNVCPRP